MWKINIWRRTEQKRQKDINKVILKNIVQTKSSNFDNPTICTPIFFSFRESFSFRLNIPCQKSVDVKNVENNKPQKIRLSNRYNNQTRVTVCLRNKISNSVRQISTCRKNVYVLHRSQNQEVQTPPSIPKINVMNIPQPIEDVSFWDNIIR